MLSDNPVLWVTTNKKKCKQQASGNNMRAAIKAFTTLLIETQ